MSIPRAVTILLPDEVHRAAEDKAEALGMPTARLVALLVCQQVSAPEDLVRNEAECSALNRE